MFFCVLCKTEYHFKEIFIYENYIICPFCILGYNNYNIVYKKFKNNLVVRNTAINKIKKYPRLYHILKSIKF